MRVVFFGTPAFAVPTLERLATDGRFELSLVVTQPDRPAGRGRRVESSAVAGAARAHGLPLYQPASLRESSARRPLAEQNADLFVVAAFGLVFGPKTLALPRLGCVNVHASLLPRHRGAAPIVAAIAAGDAQTGVTLMRMDAGLDTGPTLAIAAEPIAPDDTADTLGDRLARLGAELAVATLPRYAAGEVVPVPQPALGATLTRPLSKADGWLDWERPAVELERQIRAMSPWPGAWTTLDGAPLRIHEARIAPISLRHPPGSLVLDGDRLVVACGRDGLTIVGLQIPGGRPMAAGAFLRGRRDLPERLGETGAPPPRPPLIIPVDPPRTPASALGRSAQT